MAASDKILGTLHEALARELKNRIDSGEATAAELSAAIRFLKDNDITALATESNPLGQMLDSLEKRLPFSDPNGEYMN